MNTWRNSNSSKDCLQSRTVCFQLLYALVKEWILSSLNQKYVYLFAAQLPVLLSVCFFISSSLHLHIFNVSFERKVSYGWLWFSLEGNEGVTCICDINSLFLHFPLVCRWPHLLPSVSYRQKPGQFVSLFFRKPFFSCAWVLLIFIRVIFVCS